MARASRWEESAGQPSASPAELRRRAAAGTRIGAAAQLIRIVLALAVTAWLARLLDPADFGLVAGVLALMALAEVLRDGGLSAAAIAARSLTAAQASTLFWLNSAVGLVLAGLLALSGPLIADFYSEPAMQGIALGLAGTLLITGLSTQHAALLVREMEYRRLATAELASMVVGAACAIASAAAGAGYWSLVVLHVGTAATRTVLLWLLSGWRPGRPQRGIGLRALLGVGGNVVAVNVLNYGARHLDNVIVGRVAGTQALGLYSRAYALLLAPLQQVNQPAATVAVPVLSKLDPASAAYRDFYLRMLQSLLLITVPLVAVLVLLAPDVLELLLGPQWVPATDIYRALAVAALLQLSLSTNGWLYLTAGRTRPQLHFTLWSRPVIIAAFLVGSHWGAAGVATGYSISLAILFLPAVVSATRGTAVRTRDVVSASGLPLTAAGAALLAAWPAQLAVQEDVLILRVLLPLAAAAAATAIAGLVWPRLGTRYRLIAAVLVQHDRMRSQ